MVRQARVADRPLLQRYHRDLYRLHHHGAPLIFKDNEETEPMEDLGKTLVFDQCGTIQGSLTYDVREVEETAELYQRHMVVVLDLFVTDRARNRGVGRCLLEAVETIGRKLGCDSVEIPVFEFNQDAFGFYRRLGYLEYVRRLRKPLQENPSLLVTSGSSVVAYFDIRRFSQIDRSLSPEKVYQFLSTFHTRLRNRATSLGLELYRVQSDNAVYRGSGPVSAELLEGLLQLRNELHQWFGDLGYSSALAVALTSGPVRTGTIVAGGEPVLDLSGTAMGQLERLLQAQEAHPDPLVSEGLVIDQSVAAVVGPQPGVTVL